MLLCQKEKVFIQLCSELHIPVKKLREEDAGRRVGALLGMYTEAEEKRSEVPEGFLLPEILIFSGLDESLLDQFLSGYRDKNLKSIPLKAVVTPYNVAWPLYQLAEELKKEERMMKNRR